MISSAYRRRSLLVLALGVGLTMVVGLLWLPVASGADNPAAEARPGSAPSSSEPSGRGTPAERQAASGYPAHYLALEMQPDGSAIPLIHRLVHLDSPGETLDEGEVARRLRQPGRNTRLLQVSLIDRTGTPVFRNTVEVARWLRGEFHSGDPADGPAPIDGHLIALERPTFVVRVPAIPETTLTLGDSQARTLATFDLEQLSREIPGVPDQAVAGDARAVSAGSSGNRVDLLFVAEGYTAGQQSEFLADVDDVAAEFFSISPYSEYANYVITHSLFVPSNEAGADHPPYEAGCSSISCCADIAASFDPLAGTFVDTAFDARFCANNIHRLLVVSYGKVLAAASAVPDWDEIMVIVNDPTYGGSGGYIAAFSLHSAAPQIAQHEYGHSFADLADEYESPYPGYPPCSDITAPSCEVNVTDVVTPGSIKWSPWISPTTPIPTEPEFDPSFADIVGLFEGARYLSTGMYRPGQSCIMRSMGRPYCQVPSQAYVLRLYDGGWGTPWSGISLIEPGSLSPAYSPVLVLHPGSRVFRSAVLQPAGGPPVSIQWLVDGAPDPFAHTDTFTFTSVISDVGQIIEVRQLVSDTTPLVHPLMAGDSLQSEFTWEVLVVTNVIRLPLVLRDGGS